MANTLNTGVYREEWMTKLQERLDRPTSWMDACDVIFSSAQIFNVPYMATEFTDASGTRGTAYSFSDFTLTNDTLTVNTFRIAPVFIDRADMAQCQYATQMEMADRQGRVLKERVETAFLGTHANWTDIGDSGGSIVSGSTSPITVSATSIDDIIRETRALIIAANGGDLMERNGLCFVWRAQDFKFLEQYAQANGFNLADYALKNGIPNGYFFLGAYHYISNNHTAGHVFGGVRRIVKVGILNSTWGQIVTTQDPNLQSGIGVIARADYGFLTPTAHATLVRDINVA